MQQLLSGTNDETTNSKLEFFDKEVPKTRLSKRLKTRSLLCVSERFKSGSNAVFDGFLQKRNTNASLQLSNEPEGKRQEAYMRKQTASCPDPSFTRKEVR
jgi:hypothetical protein